ncbi:DUF2625 family protein [Dictyobacter formicarum]|uniref:DUF2625 family protein n=1 Tax=Dictyobacter formicarum TaxID=2778368 RepID=UPI00191548D9|nr:DUF2625 family protein [Dictyobacter formicarum]
MQRRSLKELINTEDPGWPLVQELIATARNQVEVLGSQRTRGEEVLLHLQVTTRSPMGAIALETGGILIDHGWLRFLGSGHERMHGNLQSWNTHGSPAESYTLDGGLVIAHDAVGGFFALNGGAFPGKPGTAFYFAPDTLKWETTNKSYSELLAWALSGDLEIFYGNMRWPGWENDLASLTADQGMSISPFLFARGALLLNVPGALFPWTSCGVCISTWPNSLGVPVRASIFSHLQDCPRESKCLKLVILY